MPEINSQKYKKLFQTISDSECKFQNTVLVEHPNFIMKIMSALALGGYLVRKHNEEETPLFA